jgi:hypothetical protein
MAEEQVLIRVDTVGAEASAAKITAVGTAAQQAGAQAGQGMAQVGAAAGTAATGMDSVAGSSEKAAISGKLVHQQFNSMLPLVGLLNPRLGMLANTLEHVRYVSGRAGGSLKDLGGAMLGGIKALLRPELLIAAVAIAGIAYAYEKVTSAAAAAKKQIEDATEALKKQREEKEKLRDEQEKGGQKTAAELTLGLLSKGADVGQLKAVTEAVAGATKRGVPDAGSRAIGLTGPGLAPPSIDDIVKDYVTEQYMTGLPDGGGSSAAQRKLIMASKPDVQKRMAAFDKAFAGTPAGIPGITAGETISAEAEAATNKKREDTLRAAMASHETTKYLEEQLKNFDPDARSTYERIVPWGTVGSDIEDRERDKREQKIYLEKRLAVSRAASQEANATAAQYNVVNFHGPVINGPNALNSPPPSAAPVSPYPADFVGPPEY